MNSRENHIPGIEIIPPTIFSAKSAAQDYINGKDGRSPISLMHDLAVAYLTIPGAEAYQESNMVTRGHKQPSRNPWKVNIMRVREIRQVAFETEAGPAGIRLSEQRDLDRRPYRPAIRALGEFAFKERDEPGLAGFVGLTLLRQGRHGGVSSSWLNMDTWVEAGESPSFIDFVFGDSLVKMLDFPDDPKPIVPFPVEMRK